MDPRIGSADLLQHFSAYDVKAELGQLEFGDVAFAGNGPTGDVLVAIERKRLSDMVTSMRDRRFAGHQLPGLLSNYEYVWLLVEGAYEAGPRGELMKLGHGGWIPFYAGTRGVLYAELSSYLTSMELRATTKAGEPLRVKRTNSPKESVAWLVSLYKNFEKGWKQHHAHDEIYAPGVTPLRSNGVRRGGYTRRDVSVMERMLCQLPGLDRLSRFIAQKYPWPEDMARMDVEGLAGLLVEVDGKEGKRRQRLGKARAEKIVGLLRRNGNGK